LAARLCEWAEHHRPAVWAEILTKYAGLSSKITLGEGMTSMGDIPELVENRSPCFRRARRR
jgi:hypothetical protein